MHPIDDTDPDEPQSTIADGSARGVPPELMQLESAIAHSTADGNTHVTSALHFRAAQIYLAHDEVLSSSVEQLALKHLWASWQLQPEDLDVRVVLAHHLEHDHQLEQVAGLYSSTAPHLKDETERGRLLLRAAELLRQQGEVEQALDALAAVEPSHNAELARGRSRQLRGVLDRLEPQEQKIRRRALELLLDSTEGPVRFPWAVALARLLDQAGDEEQAGIVWREALAIRPADPEALQAIRAPLEQAQRFEELAEVLERAAQATPHDRLRQPALLRELAQLVATRLSDPARAARFWWKAWELEPHSTLEPHQLKEVYTALEQWHGYRRVLEHEILRAVDTDDKVAAYRELARLQLEVFDDSKAAVRTYGYILHLVPDDEQALQARIEIFERAEMNDDLTLALRRFAAHTRETGRRDELLRHLARLEIQLPDSAYLIRTLRQLDPTREQNRDLVRSLRDMPRAKGKPLSRELGMLLLKMELAGGDTPSCIALALALARESIDAQEPGRAVECYRRVLELSPDHEVAKSGLRQLAQHGEPGAPTPSELAQQASDLGAEQPARAVRLLVQAATLLQQREPHDRQSLQEHLARAIELCPADATAELQLLEEALRSAEMHRPLASLLEDQAAADRQPERRKDTLRALARLYREELDDPQRSLEALNRVREIDPLDTEVIQQVRELHARLGNHEALACVLDDLLAHATGRDRIPLLLELGQLYAERLHDRAAALGRYGELLAMVPNQPVALSFCRAHDEASGNYRSVAVMLCRAAEAGDDPLARAEIHREIAQIAEHQLSDEEFAITHWRQVVELCPSDSAPRAELKRLLAQVGRWSDLERVLLSEVSRSLRPEEKVPVYLELSRIAATQLTDDLRASSYLRNALQLAPENREVLGQLETTYERLGYWRELAAVLRRHADVESQPEDQARLLLRSARVLFVHLGRDEESLAVCRMIRAMLPGDRGAATLMGEMLGKRGKWREKANLLREQIAAENDPCELGRLHLELGRLLLDNLQDSEGAASNFEVALELSTQAAEILPLLRQLYQSLGRWDLLVELIRRRATAENITPTERALALCEIGRIKEEHLADLPGAKEALERAIHLDPSHRPALTALRRLASSQQQPRDLVALSRRELLLTEDSVERSRLLLEIGEIQYHQLERPSAAAESLEQALTEDAGNTHAAELLGAIYFETQDWERAEQLLEKVVGSGIALENLHEFHYRLGYANEQLGREDEAFSHYVKSFGREPMYLPTLERLVDLCYVRNQWENTLRIGEAIVTTYADKRTPQELADLFLRIGLCELHLAQRDVAVKQLQNLILEHGEVPSTSNDAWVDAAECWAATPLESRLLGGINPEVMGRVVKAMERSLQHVPSHAGALQVLDALSITRRDWEQSLRYVERAVESVPDTRLQVRLLVCAGDVAHKHLLSAARAQAYYRRGLEILPGSELARDRLDMVEVTPARPELHQAAPPPPPPPKSSCTSPPDRCPACPTCQTCRT